MTLSRKKLISVVIPVSNREEELRRAISSVLAQSVEELEIIIVCNNSNFPERLKGVCDRFQDERINFFELKECVNANVARNFGIKKSNGDYVAFLDSDDEWESDHIKNCIDVICRTKCKFVYGATKIFDGSGFYVKNSRGLVKGENPLDFLLGFNRGYAQTSSYLVNRTCFDIVKWDEQLYRHQDYDFFIRMVSNFDSGCNVNPDVVINWVRGEPRSYHHQSVLRFLSIYKKRMGLYSYIRYHFMMMYVSFKRRSMSGFLFFVFSFFKFV